VESSNVGPSVEEQTPAVAQESIVVPDQIVVQDPIMVDLPVEDPHGVVQEQIVDQPPLSVPTPSVTPPSVTPPSVVPPPSVVMEPDVVCEPKSIIPIRMIQRLSSPKQNVIAYFENFLEPFMISLRELPDDISYLDGITIGRKNFKRFTQ
jgi:hypothetical protein